MILRRMGFPYLPVDKSGRSFTKIKAGDGILLYQSRNPGLFRAYGDQTEEFGAGMEGRQSPERVSRKPGIIGIFRATGQLESCAPILLSWVTCANRIPWKSQVIDPEKPLPLKDLAPNLEFVSDPKHYGRQLQCAIKCISKHDFDLIAAAFRAVSAYP